MGQQASYLQIVKHAIHLAHPLACILHEEDDIIEQQRVEVGTSQIVVDREVTPYDDALCPTLDVERMGRHSIGGQFALQQSSERLTDGVITLISL